MFEPGIIQIAHRVILAWGWERRFIAFLCGVTGVLAMPPIGVLPALALSMTGAVWLIDGSTQAESRLSFAAIRSAAIAGWWFGFGYFLAGLWWLGAAFLVDAEQFVWAMPLGVLGLPATLACFHAAGFALARLLWSGGAMRILALTTGLGLAEWLRGHILTGFPWNSFGQAFGEYLVTAQAASLIGVEGLSVLAIAMFATPALIASGTTGTQKYRPLFLAGMMLVAMAGFGAGRLWLDGGLGPQLDKAHLVETVRLRVMQPNIPMSAKNIPQNGEKLLETYLKLSDKAASSTASSILDTTHVIWPESPFPFLLAQNPQALNLIGAKLQGKVTLVTGAIRADVTSVAGQPTRYFNAIQVVSKDGTISDSYDKVHLVPFGEYLPAPFQWALTKLGLRQFVHVPGGFTAGRLLRPLQIDGLPPALPMICYEAVFPTEFTRDLLSGTVRPQLILNVTNDAWFGETFGPYQHFAQSRMRAIEQGLPLIRSANTGISAVIDPYGRILKSLPLGVADIIDSPLPRAIGMTIYLMYFKGMALILLLIAAVLVMGYRIKVRNIE